MKKTKWKETRNIVANSAKNAIHIFKAQAGVIGMKASGVTSRKTTMRSGGRKVYKIKGTWIEKIKGKNRRRK